MRKFLSTLVTLGVGLVMATIMPLAARAAASAVSVTPQNMNGWRFVDDQNDSTLTATGHMVVGPSNPPAGIGSAELETSTPADGQALIKNSYGGLKFSDLTSLSYYSYVKAGNNIVAPALQFSVDKNVTDSDTSWQGRIVFEPYLNGTVIDNTWQNWNPTNGNWWLTKSNLFGNMCPQASPCTLSTLEATFPNIGVNGGVNDQILFKAGSGWTTDFVGNVDKLTVAFSGNSTTYDFEPYMVASDKDQCKNGGWQGLRDQNGQAFKNQGQCVSYTNGRGQ